MRVLRRYHSSLVDKSSDRLTQWGKNCLINYLNYFKTTNLPVLLTNTQGGWNRMVQIYLACYLNLSKIEISYMAKIKTIWDKVINT